MDIDGGERMTARESGENTNENTLEEIVEQIKRDGDPELMLRLLDGVRRFSYGKAKPFFRSGVLEPEELDTIIFMALSEAVPYYDASHGTKFLSSYGWFLMRVLIMETVHSGSVRLPYHILERIRAFRKVRHNLMQQLSTEPPDAIIAHEMGVPVDAVRELRRIEMLISTRSLDAPIDSQVPDGDTLSDVLASPESLEDDMVEALYQDDLRKAIRDELRLLPIDEAQAVIMHHAESLTFREISLEQGVTIERARQRCNRGLRRLRSNTDRLRNYLDDENMVSGSGFSTWNRTGCSVQERVLIWQEERKERKNNNDKNDFLKSTERLLHGDS